jgi:putative aminopeptidase FrvX
MSGVPPILLDLLRAHGPAGREAGAAAAWRSAAAGFAHAEGHRFGSAVARVPGTAGGPSLALVGHVDEIALMVSHIDDEGFLHVIPVGGWDPQILVGQRISVVTRDGVVPGVIGRKPFHLLTEDDRGRAVQLDDLRVDIGAHDGERARRLVRVGDPAVLAGDPVPLDGNRLAARALDNRVGCFVALEAARLIAEAGGASGDVLAVASTQEEIGFAGARTAAHTLRPDLAIAVDVIHATDAAGVSKAVVGPHPLGSGPVIGCGPTLHPAISDLLQEIAAAEQLPFTVLAMGRRTLTDADVLHSSRDGVPAGVVLVPLRYMHSPVEVVQLDDVLGAARLLAAFARRAGELDLTR